MKRDTLRLSLPWPPQFVGTWGESLVPSEPCLQVVLHREGGAQEWKLSPSLLLAQGKTPRAPNGPLPKTTRKDEKRKP